MSYCDKSNIINDVPETDISYLTGSDDSIIVDLIAKSDSIIDSYLGGVYVTPLDVIDTIIQDISSSLTIYFLYTRKANLDSEYNTVRRKRYDDAMKILDRIRRKEILLSATQLTATGSNMFKINSPTRKFTDTILKGF